jgi:hypothetical protein
MTQEPQPPMTIATPSGDACIDRAPDEERCGNCGTVLLGPHCHACGQPVKGLVRHFSSVLGDLLDTVLQLDTRITRTLTPLLLRPGYLSCEYFAGRRLRYVSPVRLFFFLSVVAFLAAQWTLDSQPQSPQTIQVDNLQNAGTVAEAQHLRDTALQKIAASRVRAAKVPAVAEGLNAAEADLRHQADVRIAELQHAEATHTAPPVHDSNFEFDNAPWDPVKHPLHVSWLPESGNVWLNSLAGRAKGNLQRIRQDPNVLLDAWMSALPSTLVLLLPLFALLLKIAYAFKRRLYMEHFIVALHSHAFLCLDLLLILLLNGFDDVLGWHWAHVPLLISIILLIVWMPFYLLLMQKRVYAQGWLMTTLKFGVIGTVYLVMLSIGAALSLLAKIVWL